MRSLRLSRWFSAAALIGAMLGFTAAPSAAQTARYEFTGSASGTYDGVAFDGLAFTVTATTAIDNPSHPYAPFGIASYGNTVGRLTIPGVVTDGVFDVPLVVFANGSTRIVGFGIFGRDYLNYAYPNDDFFSTYDLSHDAGPWDTEPYAVGWDTVDVEGHAVTLTPSGLGSFTAYVTPGDPTVTPEPASLALVGSGLAGITLAGYRRRAQRLR